MKVCIRAATTEQGDHLKACGFEFNPVTGLWRRTGCSDLDVMTWMDYAKRHDIDCVVYDDRQRIADQHRSLRRLRWTRSRYHHGQCKR